MFIFISYKKRRHNKTAKRRCQIVKKTLHSREQQFRRFSASYLPRMVIQQPPPPPCHAHGLFRLNSRSCRTGCFTEWQDAPFIDNGWLFSKLVSLDTPEKRSVLRKKLDLVKHSTDDSHGMFPDWLNGHLFLDFWLILNCK